MSIKNSPKRSLDIGQKQSLNVSDADKASNFEALHEKISGTEERLNDINEQTQKKFQIVKENVFHYYIYNIYRLSKLKSKSKKNVQNLIHIQISKIIM